MKSLKQARPNFISRIIMLVGIFCSFIFLSLYLSFTKADPKDMLVKKSDNNSFVVIEKSGKLDKFSDGEVQDFEEKGHAKFLKVIQKEVDFSKSYLRNDSYSSFSLSRDCISISSMDELPSYCELLKGRLPVDDYEIMLTDYQYQSFKEHGYSYQNI